jgi:REP element-mobilizing transposase RayT
MELEPGGIFHLYNRSNNREIVFKQPENFDYFLKRFRHHLGEHLELLAFCLMPTHFHFLVRVKTRNVRKVKDKIGIWLSGYAKAINRRFERHGSLFQQHTKTRHVDDERYLKTLIAYIHNNPVRAGLVDAPEEWQYSSVQLLLKPGTEPFAGWKLMLEQFGSVDACMTFAEPLDDAERVRYWISPASH